MHLISFYALQIKAVDWPYEDTGDTKINGAEQRTIADYLADNMFDLVINLPLRNGGSHRASSFVTQGYKTRRMAVDYSVPLITDVKCTKMFVEVSMLKIKLDAEFMNRVARKTVFGVSDQVRHKPG